MGTEVLTRRDDAVMEAVIDRPDAMNALNSNVLAGLAAAFDEAEADPQVRVLVLRGSGERAFCAGADLHELSGLTPEEGRGYLATGQQLFRRIERSNVPSIAVVHGFALGGGFELALSCSFVLAGEDARFGLPEAKLGLIPGYGGTQRLIRAAGKGPALRAMLTGDHLDAATAWQLGLLGEAPIPPGQLAERSAEVAQQIAGVGPLSVAYVLEAVRGTHPTDDALEHEAALGGLAIGSGDAREGIAAFRERRAPRFEGS